MGHSADEINIKLTNGTVTTLQQLLQNGVTSYSSTSVTNYNYLNDFTCYRGVHGNVGVSVCCDANVSNGITNCWYTDETGGSWTPTTYSPFPYASSTSRYMLTCETTPAGNVICCLMNDLTGEVSCEIRSGGGIGGTWKSFGATLNIG